MASMRPVDNELLEGPCLYRLCLRIAHKRTGPLYRREQGDFVSLQAGSPNYLHMDEAGESR